MKLTNALFRAPSSVRRLPLTTKQAANKGGYYKGTGGGAMGRHTKHGGYRIHWERVRTYVVPSELAECKLSPFVTKKISPQDLRILAPELHNGRMMGNHFLDQWKKENGTY